MSKYPPPEVLALIQARDPSAIRRAWERFVRLHSPLLLEATRSIDGDYDASMNRYAFVLDKLRVDDFKRLRSYHADGRAKFTTWLAVVAKRLCIDHHRHRYGRPQGGASNPGTAEPGHLMRSRLADLSGFGEVDELQDRATPDAETRLIREELLAALKEEISALDPRDRLLLTLRFEDGATAREIRETMGYPSLGHVYRRLDKLLAQLREALRARGLVVVD